MNTSFQMTEERRRKCKEDKKQGKDLTYGKTWNHPLALRLMSFVRVIQGHRYTQKIS